MPEYLVEWNIEIEAGTPEQAAKLALEIQRDPASTATIFDVYNNDDEQTIAELGIDVLKLK